jgi:hypothetical protein
MKEYKVTISVSVIDNFPLSIKDYLGGLLTTAIIHDQHYRLGEKLLKYSIDRVEEVKK